MAHVSFCCTWTPARLRCGRFLSFSPASRQLLGGTHKKGTSIGCVCSVFAVFSSIQLFWFAALLNQSEHFTTHSKMFRTCAEWWNSVNHCKTPVNIFVSQNTLSLTETKTDKKKKEMAEIYFCPHIFQFRSMHLHWYCNSFLGQLLLLHRWSFRFHLPVCVPCHLFSSINVILLLCFALCLCAALLSRECAAVGFPQMLPSLT